MTHPAVITTHVLPPFEVKDLTTSIVATETSRLISERLSIIVTAIRNTYQEESQENYCCHGNCIVL